MYCFEKLADGLYWIGGEDARLGKFEGLIPVPYGMSYNTYLIKDEKTVLIDTIDRAVEERFLTSLDYLIGDGTLDYIITQHAEPDHMATLGSVAARYPEAKILASAMCKRMISQFFDDELAARVEVIDDGDTLETGKRTLKFLSAPMVHWPEVMMTYDAYDKTLFSADAFGVFGSLDGRLRDIDRNFEQDMLPEMRRYYANICGKYGAQVDAILDKVEPLDIARVCTLHGPVVEHNAVQAIHSYRIWAGYQPEVKSVAIMYASIYGGTRDVAEKLAFLLTGLGVEGVKIYDVCEVDASYLLAEAYRVSNVVLACATMNMEMNPKMADLLEVFATHGLKNRKFSLIQNGSWAPQSGKRMLEALEKVPGTQIVGDMFTIKSRMKNEQEGDLEKLAQAIAESVGAVVTASEVEQHEKAPEASPLPAGFVPPVAPPKVNDPYGAGAATKPTQVIEVWKCTYCGYQVEVPQGTDMSNFTCPVCLKVGMFKKVREKIVEVES